MRYVKGNIATGYLTLALAVAFSTLLIIGWVGNIVKLSRCDFEAPYRPEVIRTIGVFVPPVGVVAGYLDIDDKKKG